MSTLPSKIKHDFLKALAPTLLFFFMLHVVALIRSLMIRGSGGSLATTASILIASLMLGKSVRVADMLPFINRFPDKLLILITKINWPRFWAIQIVLVALILMYAVITELTRAIGRGRLKIIFFGPLHQPSN